MSEAQRSADSGAPWQGPHWLRDVTGPAAPARLVLRPGGQIVELSRPEMLIGRHSTADVRLPLPDVSRHHCRLAYADGNWQVVDLGSLNGTFVNEQVVRHAPLRHRDRLRVGSYTFEVELPAADHTALYQSSDAADEDAPLRSGQRQAS